MCSFCEIGFDVFAEPVIAGARATFIHCYSITGRIYPESIVTCRISVIPS